MARFIEIPEDNERAKILAVTITVFCPHCREYHEVMGTLVDNELKIPDYWYGRGAWDICEKCIPRKNNPNNNEKYKYTQILARYPFLTNGYTGETYNG